MHTMRSSEIQLDSGLASLRRSGPWLLSRLEECIRFQSPAHPRKLVEIRSIDTYQTTAILHLKRG